ncbi:MAG TPA: non-homologous end-joining DNA ligase [Bryobacteraceae bacterium]|jgi:bifunctional non-homologous end joining protein LigD
MKTKQQFVDVDGRHIALSNLDKVLYPGNGFSKVHVIDYYTRIAPVLLPHFAHRPVTMLRFPDGVHGKAFYEKDAPKYTPEWAHTTLVPRQAGGEPIRYICINDLPTLIWCANLASLELHPFLHNEDNLDCPSSVVFDLDPGEGMDLVNCAEVALLLRAHLADAGLECFAKVSGSKGLQIYVPLNTPVTYAQTRSFAQAAAKALEGNHPKLVVSEMAKQLRRGKIFIDWSQNSDFKTTIGVYSLRAKSDVPYVSAPVTWDELEKLRGKATDPSALRFDPQSMLKRIAKIGDLFAPLLTLEQSLSPAGEKTKSKAPAFVEPMLLLSTHALPEGKDWSYEIKLDGYRALAAKTRGRVELRSRNDKNFAVRFAAIAEALKKMPDNTMIDGEVVALDEDGRPSFNLLQNHGSSNAPIVFYAFDLLTLLGKNVMNEPLTTRRTLLREKVLVHLEEPIRFSPDLEAALSVLVNSVKAQGLEGLVAKKRDSRYEPGQRSGSWQKMRINLGQELVIGGYTPGAKNFDALVIGYYEDGKLLYAARTRNGFTPALRDSLFAKLHKLEIDDCPFANLPEKTGGRWGQGLTAAKMKDCRWLKPVTVAQFEFVEWTPENHLRHAKFVGLREDKKAADVGREGA